MLKSLTRIKKFLQAALNKLTQGDMLADVVAVIGESLKISKSEIFHMQLQYCKGLFTPRESSSKSEKDQKPIKNIYKRINGKHQRKCPLSLDVNGPLRVKPQLHASSKEMSA